MTTALATSNSAPSITAEQMDLIRRTVAKDATPDELKLYLYDCARQGVHPLDKLIFFTKRSGKYTPITSIDFMRMRAAETGEYAGSEDAAFESGEGVPVKATVTVWRLVQGQRCPFTATARWAEYKPEANDFMWKKMPHGQLGKCAEALALRKGFPKQLAGLYAREEMDQAGSEPLTIHAPTLAPEGVDPATGEEVGPSAAKPRAPEDAPYRYIHKCENGTGRLKGTVTLCDGRMLKVWQDQLWTVLQSKCQDGKPIVPKLIKKNERWGDSLESILAGETVPLDAPEPPSISDKDIPF